MRDLRVYEAELRRSLSDQIPRNATSVYSPREQMILKAYCVLVHAAIEEHIEQTLRELVCWHCDKWKKRARPKATVVLMALIAHHEVGYNKQHAKGPATSIDAKSNIGARIAAAQVAFAQIIEHNHGISVRHLSKMLRPTGISLTIDADTESALSKLKEYRGEYAHVGSIKVVPSIEDLEDHVKRCLELCSMLSKAADALC